MSAVGRSGPHESSGRAPSRRGGWAQLGRRGGADPEPAAAPRVPVGPESGLLPVAVRSSAEAPAEEHHLGERLSSFVDGELGHDSRDRVQAHLATCPQCLAEADAGRAVKHLLTHTGTPAPSSTLMARLLAVGALGEQQDDDGAQGRRDDNDRDDRSDDGRGGPGGGLAAVTGTLGGSRLNGGSFGRGAGAPFGAGALGADAPLPGVDPRAFGRGSVLRPLMGRRGPQTGSGGPLAAAGPGTPTAAATEPSGASGRPVQPRARRFVFAAAAAGAFSVAAVTLGGVGGLPAPAGDDRPGTAVTPARGPVGGAPVPMSGQVPVDFPVLPVAATRTAAVPGDSGRLPVSGSPYGGAPYSGGFHGDGPYGDGSGRPR
ncbi:zf-HC2 domain-containing protein [Kitasatospora sp. NBC_00240]|uniref:zf-HC2 domain-containing protein n=1 Tax=Kitasatospora sp. NBC_00240 TaxID=2903567 RepID=UPI0022593F71|nr:zf-HC2 domain-containing protein [Kitasatospora sp. NBC_00240]MCX5210952.1 zf-HC2 domain-containing protein [Kitasatospora sp. NBC_00240]